MSDALRVLLADDQEMVRVGLTTILDAQPDLEVVGQASTGREAVALAARLRPDVCLFDIRMPDLDGIEATRQVAGPEVSDPVPVVVITTFDDDDYVYDALAAVLAGSCSRTPTPSCWPRPCGSRRVAMP